MQPQQILTGHLRGTGMGGDAHQGLSGMCRKYDIAAHRRMCAAKYFLLHGAIFGKAPFASRGQRPRNRGSPLSSGLSPGGGQTPDDSACRALALDRKAVAKLHWVSIRGCTYADAVFAALPQGTGSKEESDHLFWFVGIRVPQPVHRIRAASQTRTSAGSLRVGCTQPAGLLGNPKRPGLRSRRRDEALGGGQRAPRARQGGTHRRRPGKRQACAAGGFGHTRRITTMFVASDDLRRPWPDTLPGHAKRGKNDPARGPRQSGYLPSAPRPGKIPIPVAQRCMTVMKASLDGSFYSSI